MSVNNIYGGWRVADETISSGREAREMARAELEKDVAAFLEKGGAIETLPYCAPSIGLKGARANAESGWENASMPDTAAATYLGVPYSTFLKAMRTGELMGIKAPKKSRGGWFRCHLDKWLKAYEQHQHRAIQAANDEAQSQKAG
ncbi:hypothetical protein [Hahella ganghwensis]|uniref:hypothetical protein n=1 Tax=Hahella ganghwensis TaxID=286420 RepID=UPI00036DC8AA|nr:hypothetical protein [Hahella ganghwensis]